MWPPPGRMMTHAPARSPAHAAGHHTIGMVDRADAGPGREPMGGGGTSDLNPSARRLTPPPRRRRIPRGPRRPAGWASCPIWSKASAGCCGWASGYAEDRRHRDPASDDEDLLRLRLTLVLSQYRAY